MTRSLLFVFLLACAMQLLEYTRGVRPAFSIEAHSVLQSFYSASRRVRASSVHGTDMPLTGLDAL